MADIEARIEAQHGPNCTCTRLKPINFQPVIAGPNCPGEPTRHTGQHIAEPEVYGSVIITWPAAAKSPFLGAPLLPWPMMIHDHATGEQMLGVSGLRMAIGGKSWNDEIITVDLTELVGDDGKPLRGERILPVRGDDGRVRTGVFRYYVAEMRIREDNKRPLSG